MHDAHPPVVFVREAVARALAEDLTPIGDLSAALVPPDRVATARFVPRAPGVLAGRSCADEAFRQVDEHLTIEWSADDGDPVAPGEAFAQVTGPLAPMLTAERTALNFLGHLSGVATLTAAYVRALAAAGGSLRVWDTRKTTPGLRALEKAAVRAGGGWNHRGNLSDWVMLKDNHLAVLGVADAVARAHARWPGRTIHVECGDAETAREAVKAGADALLLDNLAADDVAAIVRETREEHPHRPLIEVSGGITLETVGRYATSGADMVSIGALTHSAPVLDIGLDVDEDVAEP